MQNNGIRVTGRDGRRQRNLRHLVNCLGVLEGKIALFGEKEKNDQSSEGRMIRMTRFGRDLSGITALIGSRL
jgi:hypothetical protein